MRKSVLLAAMLAMVLAVAVPAFAQATQYQATQYQYADYQGEAYQDVEGLTIGECAQIVQQANTGYVGQAQYDDRYVPQYQYGVVADVDGDGYVDEGDHVLAQEQAVIDANLQAQPSPVLIQYCQDTINTGVVGGENDGGGAAELPATSGISLLTLGAGALLVAGGLVTRKLIK